jgi:hypothetical protein
LTGGDRGGRVLDAGSGRERRKRLPASDVSRDTLPVEAESSLRRP